MGFSVKMIQLGFKHLERELGGFASSPLLPPASPGAEEREEKAPVALASAVINIYQGAGKHPGETKNKKQLDALQLSLFQLKKLTGKSFYKI